MGDSFAERLRRLEDAEQIRQLNLAYRRHLDARDLDAYGRLFADDGEWLGGTGYGQGPAGITAMLTERLAGNPAPPGPTSWHLVTESGVDVRGDWATGTVTWALIQRGDGDQPVMRLLGHYDDVYVRERGRWRYQRRIAHTDIPHRTLDVPADWTEGAAARAGSGARTEGDAEERLRRLEDLEQIRQLFVEYKMVLDKQDFAAYGALFAADGEFIATPEQGLQQAKGPAAIQALVEAMPGSLLVSEPGADFHVVVNPLIELDAADPHRAQAQVTWLYVVKGEDGAPALCKLGHYDDQLIREAGQWRFLRREAPTDIG
jgi:ketosteroid isomerase-like protein